MRICLPLTAIAGGYRQIQVAIGCSDKARTNQQRTKRHHSHVEAADAREHQRDDSDSSKKKIGKFHNHHTSQPRATIAFLRSREKTVNLNKTVSGRKRYYGPTRARATRVRQLPRDTVRQS